MTSRFSLPFIILLSLCSFTTPVLSQNLIPNGSFDNFVECPDGLTDNIVQCQGWWNSRGSCDYYNSCADGCTASVPCNVNGHQDALTPGGYAGFVQYASPNPDYREQMICELSNPLEIGMEYFFSMYINRGVRASIWLNKASNGQGVRFTNTPHFAEVNPGSIVDAQFINHEVVEDSTFWNQLRFNFVADSSYTHIIIGGFLPDAQLEISTIGDPVSYGEAYYFVDEVRLSTDSSFAWQALDIDDEKPESLSLYPNPTSTSVMIEGLEPNSQIKIWNVGGQIVAQLANETHRFELGFLPPGIYVFEIIGARERQVIRVVKE